MLFTPYCVSRRLNSCVVSNKKGFCCIQFGKFQLIQRLNFISSFPFSDVTNEAATNDEGEPYVEPYVDFYLKGQCQLVTVGSLTSRAGGWTISAKT